MLQVNVSVLDVNDNDPMFSSTESRVSFREDVPVGSLMYVARAHDRDSGANALLTYSTSGDADPHFQVQLLKLSIDRTLNHWEFLTINNVLRGITVALSFPPIAMYFCLSVICHIRALCLNCLMDLDAI